MLLQQRKRRKQTNERSAAHEASTSSLRDRSLEKIAHDRGGRKLPPFVCWIESTTPWIAWIDDGGIVGLEIGWDIDRCRPHLGSKRGRRRGFRLLACSLLFCFSIDVCRAKCTARADRPTIDRLWLTAPPASHAAHTHTDPLLTHRAAGPVPSKHSRQQINQSTPTDPSRPTWRVPGSSPAAAAAASGFSAARPSCSQAPPSWACRPSWGRRPIRRRPGC